MFSDGRALTRKAAHSSFPTRVTQDQPTTPRTTIRLTGDTARRRCGKVEMTLWDSELPGFGLRMYPSGIKSWIVHYVERGVQRKATLGRVGSLDAKEARKHARAILARSRLDGLPHKADARLARKGVPLFRDYVDRFWSEYSRHWKPNTQKRNAAAIRRDLLPVFGTLAVSQIARTDVARWRDDLIERPGTFNRTLPVLAVMLGYAEQLGLRRRGSNPCKAMPRYKRKPCDRFLTAIEYRRLASMLAEAEVEQPSIVAAIRLLIYTGARRGEVEGLRWEWVQPPRLMLPDSKTGAKAIYLNTQAMGVLESIPGQRGTGLIFPAPCSNQPINLGTWWVRLRRRAALPDVRLHDLRHSFASTAIMDGVSLSLIGRLLGHALPETTARYAHLADEAVMDAAERVSGSLAAALGLRA